MSGSLPPPAVQGVARVFGLPGFLAGVGPRSQGGWVNLGPGLVCHPPSLPTAGAAAGKVGGGGLFWERLLSNSCHRPSVAVFL